MQLTLEKQKLPAALYIVSTPIGNLKDITLRALETLMSVDFVACEDTRVTGVLLGKYGFKTPFMVYTDHADEGKRERIFSEILAGKSIALVSDAGTPLISDPGYRLVAEAFEAGIKVISVPGACAGIAALSISGLATDKFYFAGFLPKKAGAAKEFLSDIANLKASLIFYERGTRVADSLQLFLDAFGDRQAVIAREITKRFEETKIAKISELIAAFEVEKIEERGEFVLIIDGVDENANTVEFSDQDIMNFINKNRNSYKPKVLAEMVANTFKVNKKDAYNKIIADINV